MKAVTKKLLIKEKENLSPKTNFLFQYKKDKKYIYGFVEGAEDISFYQNFVKSHLMETDCIIHFYPCGNKQKVLEMYNRIDWALCSIERVLFFVDRDLSDFFKEDKVKKKNIYITDKYSIENSIITDELLIRHLQESGAIPILNEKAERFLRNQFNILKKEFCIGLFDIMIWFVSLKYNNRQAVIKNLPVSQIVSVENMRIIVCDKHKKADVFEQYAKFKPVTNRKIKKEFLSHRDVTKYIRGKFLIEFFSMFVDDFFKNYKNIPLLQDCRICKKGVSKNIESFAHRCKCPTSLIKFFKRTIDER